MHIWTIDSSSRSASDAHGNVAGEVHGDIVGNGKDGPPGDDGVELVALHEGGEGQRGGQHGEGRAHAHARPRPKRNLHTKVRVI